MIHKKIFDLKELEWEPTRQNLTERVFGKSLIPFMQENIKIVLTKVEPGGTFSKHEDPYHHVFYFIKGQGQGWLGDKTYEIKPERVVVIPSGERHGYKNTAQDDMILLTINIPLLLKK
ncbi:MAG: cupin domain-containing protein [Candidatus Hodarchaeales archaeon]